MKPLPTNPAITTMFGRLDFLDVFFFPDDPTRTKQVKVSTGECRVFGSDAVSVVSPYRVVRKLASVEVRNIFRNM